MILFKDILKDTLGEKVSPEDFTDSDLKSVEGLKIDDEPCLDNGDGEKTVNIELFKKRKVRPVTQ
jgi:hypothetical protein